jgi:hypothetical protein
MIDRALAMDIARYVPGHGFIEEPAISREDLVTYRQALVDVIAEVKRLHASGAAVEDAVRLASWGPYRERFLAEQQGPIAVRRVYDQILGRLP